MQTQPPAPFSDGEELDVDKRVTEDTERVTDTVTREQFRVDEDVNRSDEPNR